MLLAHRYFRKGRHQSADTHQSAEPTLNRRTRIESHPYFMSLSVRTDLSVRDYALEGMANAWNNLPLGHKNAGYTTLHTEVSSTHIQLPMGIYRDIFIAIRRL